VSGTLVAAYTPTLIFLSSLAKGHRMMSIDAEQTCVSTIEINEKLEVVLTKETRVLEINTREM
jgi:hypothetical protein